MHTLLSQDLLVSVSTPSATTGQVTAFSGCLQMLFFIIIIIFSVFLCFLFIFSSLQSVFWLFPSLFDSVIPIFYSLVFPLLYH